jgi:hypothetical protein
MFEYSMEKDLKLFINSKHFRIHFITTKLYMTSENLSVLAKALMNLTRI